MNASTTSFQECIEACQACLLACHQCLAACLREEDVKSMAACIAHDLECAATCELAIQAMAQRSPHVNAICRLCADICHACANECGKHKHDHCQDCATACISCAAACRTMGNQMN